MAARSTVLGCAYRGAQPGPYPIHIYFTWDFRSSCWCCNLTLLLARAHHHWTGTSVRAAHPIINCDV